MTWQCWRRLGWFVAQLWRSLSTRASFGRKGGAVLGDLRHIAAVVETAYLEGIVALAQDVAKIIGGLRPSVHRQRDAVAKD
jgi:hypothetical protein